MVQGAQTYINGLAYERITGEPSAGYLQAMNGQIAVMNLSLLRVTCTNKRQVMKLKKSALLKTWVLDIVPMV